MQLLYTVLAKHQMAYSTATQDDDDDDVNTGAIVGGVVGGISGATLLILLIILLWFCYIRKRGGKSSRTSMEHMYTVLCVHI